MKPLKCRDLILKPSQGIYNNIAEFENIRGRLTLDLQITPSPLLLWEFECIDESELDNVDAEKMADQLFDRPLNNISANEIEIISPRCRHVHWRGSKKAKNKYSELGAKGFSREFHVGDISRKVTDLAFYLPNFRIHSVSEDHNLPEGDSRSRFGKENTFIFERAITDKWIVSLETDRSAFDWLDAAKGNTGTLITTRGTLRHIGNEMKEDFAFKEMQKITDRLSLLLSFANGGYTSPILYEGYRIPPRDDSSAEAFKYFNANARITPLEQLKTTWYLRESHLANLVRCYQRFAAVFDNNFWHESFLFILENYLLAISTPTWQIAASAIGAVIERLAFLVLVEDEKDPEQQNKNNQLFGPGSRKTNERIRQTLIKIGLSKDRNIDDIDQIENFVTVRNDAVHPINRVMTKEQRWESIRYGLQWTEEIILWKLGYTGWYRNRISVPKQENKEYQAGPGIFIPRYYYNVNDILKPVHGRF